VSLTSSISVCRELEVGASAGVNSRSGNAVTKSPGDQVGSLTLGGRANGRFAAGGLALLARLAMVDSSKSPLQSKESSSSGGAIA
jgi:hypothetical protein